jgi:hypothetical protein
MLALNNKKSGLIIAVMRHSPPGMIPLASRGDLARNAADSFSSGGAQGDNMADRTNCEGERYIGPPPQYQCDSEREAEKPQS